MELGILLSEFEDAVKVDGIFVGGPEGFICSKFLFDVDICADDIATTSLGIARFSVTFPGRVFHVVSYMKRSMRKA